MQVRRPLCLFSLVFVLLVAGCVYGGRGAGEKLPAEGEQVVLTGTVVEKEYRVMYGEKVPVLYLRSTEDKDDRQVMCYMEDPKGGEIPCMGETVRVLGKASLFREASNPGEFDLKAYYQILNVSYKLNRTEILERSESCFQLKEKLFRIKCRCREVLEKVYPPGEASLLSAILLGDKTGLEEEIKELYQLNGLIHILSISGLHVSLLGMAISGLLKKWGLPVWLWAPVAAGVMWCYGIMTGMGVSTWRAIFMFSLHLAAELFGRTYDMLTALALAAVLMLAGQPLLVKHSGFLLSFGAVLGIGVVLPWWKEILGQVAAGLARKRRGDRRLRRKERDGNILVAGSKRGLSNAVKAQKGKSGAKTAEGIGKKLAKAVKEGFCLSTAIAIATLPVLYFFYYKYSFYSLFLNLYVIPLMSIVFAAGMASMAAGFLSPGLGVLFGIPVRSILWLYEVSCRETLKLPGAVKIGGQPEIWQIFFYYGILIFLILWQELTGEFAAGKAKKGAFRSFSGKRKGMPKDMTGMSIPAVNQCLFLLGALWLLFVRPCGGFTVSFLDVGQGDCIVMENENGSCYMVDGGSTSKSQVGKYQMLPFLESRGIGELEAVFLTHPDEDHISGVMELMEQSDYGVNIKNLILPDVSGEMKEEELAQLRSEAARFGIPVYYIGRGDVLYDRNLKFSCLGPEKGYSTDEVNEISTVLYVEYGDFRMLLTGDVTGRAEEELLSELRGREKLTVLKVAHHGSKYSTPRELLEMTDPVYALISAGKDNRYGHPHEELTGRLLEQGCRIYQTSDSGAVTIRIRNGRILVEEFLVEEAGG